MLSVEDAREKILSQFNQLEEVNLKIENSLGCIISKDIISKFSVPPWNNSAMDGYALIYQDVMEATEENIIFLKVIEEIAAGEMPKKKISRGFASRIMTGAPIPEGADAVIPFEPPLRASSAAYASISIAFIFSMFTLIPNYIIVNFWFISLICLVNSHCTVVRESFR